MNELYFVEVRYGRRLKSFVELDRDKNSRHQVVSDIRDGQLENVLKVLEVCEDEGTCRDVTEDILREAGRLYEDGPSVSPADRLAFQHDHERDLRKHMGAV